MQKYKFIDHTADILFEAYGKTLNELFENAALAVEDTQVDLKTVKGKEKRQINLENNKLDMLLYNFLQELLYYKDAEELLFNKFKVRITETTPIQLIALCFGEKIKKSHHLKVDAKAITLHQFEIKKENAGWKARVLIDI